MTLFKQAFAFLVRSIPLLFHVLLARPHHVSKSSLMALASGLSPFGSSSTGTDSSFLLLNSGVPHHPMVWCLSSSMICMTNSLC